MMLEHSWKCHAGTLKLLGVLRIALRLYLSNTQTHEEMMFCYVFTRHFQMDMEEFEECISLVVFVPAHF